MMQHKQTQLLLLKLLQTTITILVMVMKDLKQIQF